MAKKPRPRCSVIVNFSQGCKPARWVLESESQNVWADASGGVTLRYVDYATRKAYIHYFRAGIVDMIKIEEPRRAWDWESK